MNYDGVLAALFPGAAGRTIAELTRRHARGERQIDVDEAASGAAVVPDQLRKVATRLGLLGLVEFPITDQLTLVGEHVIWSALHDLAAPQDRIRQLAAEVVSGTADATLLAVSGPVAEGTAIGYPDHLDVTLHAPEPLPVETTQVIADAISRGIGNACTVQVLTNQDVPDDGAATS